MAKAWTVSPEFGKLLLNSALQVMVTGDWGEVVGRLESLVRGQNLKLGFPCLVPNLSWPDTNVANFPPQPVPFRSSPIL